MTGYLILYEVSKDKIVTISKPTKMTKLKREKRKWYKFGFLSLTEQICKSIKDNGSKQKYFFLCLKETTYLLTQHVRVYSMVSAQQNHIANIAFTHQCV